MQSLIGDFGEVLIKELYRVTSLKSADEAGGVPRTCTSPTLHLILLLRALLYAHSP